MTENPAELMARAIMVAKYKDASEEYRAELWRLNREAFITAEQLRIAALEAAGFRIVHPDGVTERMASAAGEEVLAQYSACMHWEEAKDVVEGLDDAFVVSVAIAAAPTYATPAAAKAP